MVTRTSVVDRFAAARAVADAVLYEGYLLYPYRASSAKNRLRWQFGVVAPAAFAAEDPSERAAVRTEVVIAPGDDLVVNTRLRFLQLERRTAGPNDTADVPWDEARAHEVDLPPLRLLGVATSRTVAVHVDGGSEYRDHDGRTVMLERRPLDGSVHLDTCWVGAPGGLLRLSVSVVNETAYDPSPSARGTRDDALHSSFVGVHVLLGIDGGSFVSALDPPADAAAAVATCAQDGLYPVLVGVPGRDDVVLASPIILYDHPAVAPESAGDMFDATEIDEILALRVLTLTDEEKAAARRTDARAAEIIDRCDSMPPAAWERLHGTVRAIESAPPIDDAPWWDPDVDAQYDPFGGTLTIAGHDVAVGTRVRLRPSRRADAHDMFITGMDATVSGIFTDVDGEVLVAVTLEDDPAAEVLAWQGRYLFFHPDEVEVLQ